MIILAMGDLCRLIWYLVAGLFRSRAALHAEILVLRHQLNVLRRKSPKRPIFSNVDRLIFAGLCGLTPRVLDALKILKPATVIRWHRAGFRAYWRWKSRPRGGRPRASAEVRKLIREMSIANPLWGAPRIHGELLKLGIDVGQTTVAKYMAKTRRPPSQGWKTFLCNHASAVASMDLFVVPTVSFRLLYGLVILRHSRRELLWLGVTAHPNAEWIAQQLTEAMAGRERRDISSAIAIASMGKPSFGVWEPWVFETDRSRRARHGRTDTRSGSSVRSGGRALTMLLCSANGICAICFGCIRATQ
ncbi:MAG TPA: helix-turn-helix domain-containing protein [Bradyrhizobium sp.]|nr:helix-turn-helix domain-containing protein [Bradyrhizobium sp.]